MDSCSSLELNNRLAIRKWSFVKTKDEVTSITINTPIKKLLLKTKRKICQQIHGPPILPVLFVTPDLKKHLVCGGFPVDINGIDRKPFHTSIRYVKGASNEH